MSPKFVYEVRLVKEGVLVYNRLFSDSGFARCYIHSLTRNNIFEYQVPTVGMNGGWINNRCWHHAQVLLYRVAISDSLLDHPTPTRMLIYRMSPEDRYLFKYLQMEFKGIPITEHELK